MDFIKKLIGGQEEPLEQRRETNGMAEQSIPVAENYQPVTNNNNNGLSSSRKSNKKTRKMATIVRPRTINVQKIPKSMKNRFTNLENKVVSYENKIMNENKEKKEEIIYVPIVFRSWGGPSGQSKPIEFVRNTATQISLSENNYNRDQGSSSSFYYDFDVISQLKYLKKITILGSQYGANIIINDKSYGPSSMPLNKLKTTLENTYPKFKNIEIFIMPLQ